MKPITLYGIPNCDTVKRARAWLAGCGVTHSFHDFKRDGVPPERLQAWTHALGWELLINRQGTTWRKLDEAAKASITDAATARAIMLAQPSIIKRPVVEWGDAAVTVGFDEQGWTARLR